MFDNPNKNMSGSWTDENENRLSQKYPLHKACRDGNVGQLNTLLSQLQQNIQNSEILNTEEDSYGWTAAHFAAYFGQVTR